VLAKLSDRFQHKIDRKKKKAQGGKILGLLILVGILALGLCIDSGRVARQTIINTEPIVLMYILSGLVFGSLTYNYHLRLMKKDFLGLTHFSVAILLFGHLTASIFYITNRKFSDGKTEVIQAAIIKRLEAYRRLSNRVIVLVDGVEQDISFANKSMSQINGANYVNLTVINGRWGFHIILNSELTYKPE
jgi:hypothetical protein